MSLRRASAATFVALFITACGNSADPIGADPHRGKQNAGTIHDGSDRVEPDDVVRLSVPEKGAAMVRLSDGASWMADELHADTTWDIAFVGWDVRTNGGASGPGKASVIGPFENDVFEEGVWPAMPVMFEDHIGGAFVDWYLYDSAGGNVLYSRYHVYGVRDGDKLWKLQVLAYYGDIDGSPVSAMYSVRYARLHADGQVGETITATHLNATGAGLGASSASRSECLDLGTGARAFLSPEEAAVSSDWHLCFLRNSITVNGELGGPRGIGAVDLDAAALESETLQVIKTRTADSDLARFDAVRFETFANASFRGDRVVSAFEGRWIDEGASPPTTNDETWSIIGADGISKYLVAFAGLEGASESGPGTVKLRVKAAR